jgi:hypothetical protein
MVPFTVPCTGPVRLAKFEPIGKKLPDWDVLPGPQIGGRPGPSLKGTQTIDHAALVYSWMRPPSRSRRRTGPAMAAGSARPIGLVGVANASPRCGLSRL